GLDDAVRRDDQERVSLGPLHPAGDQPPVVIENLGSMMCEYYRQIGIFAHDQPVRDVVDRIEALDPDWIHGMHGGSLGRETIPYFTRALREESVGYQGRAARPRRPAEVRGGSAMYLRGTTQTLQGPLKAFSVRSEITTRGLVENQPIETGCPSTNESVRAPYLLDRDLVPCGGSSLLGGYDACGDVRQRRAELLAGADPELAEHLAQVPLHGARTEEELGA